MQTASFLFEVAVFAPLASFLLAGGFGHLMGDAAARALTIALMACAALSAIGVLGFEMGDVGTFVVPVADWVHAAGFRADWQLRMDMLSVSVVAMVTVVSLLVHVYSVGYMAHEARPVYRFFSYLSLFTFAMLMLVTSDNLLQLFFGWEGVGLASYLLIGYWYDRPSACAAAIKAFVVNRVADLFFLLGISLIFIRLGSVSYDDIFAAIPYHVNDTFQLFGTHPLLEVIATLLFIGAMGKSAQLFLHTWLPDAMEGPTPVSALIHAATMVTAGVFLMVRMSPLVELAPVTRDLIILVGGTTSFFAATVGLVQPDIKRTIAYSTCSQLGYMFVAVGVGAYQASMFHLTTHAFFKALLFLGAGCVIHAVHDEQDMFRMGGLWRKIPFTYGAMWIGSLALAGIFPFAGYWSKDAILEAAWMSGSSMGHYGWVMGCITAFLTALYSWRLIFLVFHGTPRDAHLNEGAHESPPSMLMPLAVLSVGAVVAGFVLAPFYIGAHQVAFWNGAIAVLPGHDIMERLEQTPGFIALVPTLAAVAGIAVAYVCYIASPGIPASMARGMRPLYLFLLNKWYFDELYGFIFVRPYRALARFLWKGVDEDVVEGIPEGLARLTAGSAGQAVRVQTGSIAVYAFSMLIGLVVLLSTMLFAR
ncbi:NADH-quinone oxidoreductase subunit L [Komagataeibacter sp. FNDCF1]|uniref:NADH-quinone oxidoreductase subunit L n=1 Tax=Komagataeibacter sp. FNDCF1 TaxID=2878681 RepID=UPI001E5ADFE2|nr:NADH-quinone oxidoreductase subunit L [Komagataeibacter sp. FNDCF1]MCE2564211.1 NADH-quinone oxidoreductase subunit L [Komagataeibacter sp. FNDCF1]